MPFYIGNRGIADVIERTHQTFATDKVGLKIFLNVSPSRILIIIFQSLENVGNGEVHATKFIGVYRNFVLFAPPAKGVYFNYARNHCHLAFYNPFLHGAQFHVIVNGIIAGLYFEGVLVNLTQSGTNGSHKRLGKSFRDVLLNFGQCLTHQLSWKVCPHIILKYYCYH